MPLPRRPGHERDIRRDAHPRQRARLVVVAAVGTTVALVGAYGAYGAWRWTRRDDPFTPSTPRLAHGPAAGDTDPMTEPGFGYHWRPVPIGGGGWVTGLVAPADADGVMYARTDVGGAYRWDPDSERWTQMLTTTSTAAFGGRSTDLSVESLAVAPSDPEVVYLSVGDDSVVPAGEEQPDPTGRVLRSTDGGATWAASGQAFLVGGNMGHRQRSERLAVHPADPDVAVLGTRTQGLWRTDDGGTTWRQVPTDEVPVGRTGTGDETSPAGISFATFVPTGDGDATLYVGVAGDGVYRSDDGRSWRRIDAATDGADAPFEGSVAGGGLLVAWRRTDNEGDGRIRRYDLERGTWRDITPDQSASEWSITADPGTPDHLLAADLAVIDGRVWRSVDGGTNWESLDVTTRSPKLPWYDQKDVTSWMSVGRLVMDPAVPGRLWFAEGLGVWRADDVFRSQRLELVNESVGIEETVAAKVVAPPGGDPISVLADVQGFWHPDLGAYPTAPLVDPTFAGGTDVDWSGRHPEVLVWAGAEYQRYWDSDRPGRGAVSRDGGRTWAALPNLSPDQFGGNVAVSATDPDNIVWVPSYYINPYEFRDPDLARGVFVTTDGGGHWTELDGVGGSHRFHRLMWWFARQALASDKVDGATFYLNDDERHFWVSTDGGLTWDEAAHAPPCLEANACHVHGQLRAAPDRAGEVWASVGDDGLYRTSDRGATAWQKVPGVDEVESYDFGAALPGHDRPAVYLYGKVGGDDEPGIWRSADWGATWTLIGRRPLGALADISNVSGDLDEPGRVYVAFGGEGVAWGEESGA